MEANEILILRTLGYGLAETSEKSDGASMSVATARQLGRLILGMISDNQRMASVVLLYRQMRNDFALLEESKAVACSNYEGLKAERDSLKALHEQETKSLSGLLVEVQRERDSLGAQLDIANGMLLEARGERDSLKHRLEVLNDPLVELAVRFVSQCKAAVGRADAFAKEKEAKLKGGGVD